MAFHGETVPMKGKATRQHAQCGPELIRPEFLVNVN